MKITKKGTYALEAMVYLALHENAKISLKFLAQEFNWSHKFLEHIFTDLRQAGLITSYRGTKGGFALLKEADSITCKDIIQACEDHYELVSCLSETCKKQDTCLTHNLWKNLQTVIDDSLENITLFDIVQTYRKEQEICN